MRLSLARERERGLATASLSGARMMSLFAVGEGKGEGKGWRNGNRGTDSVVQITTLFSNVEFSNLFFYL